MYISAREWLQVVMSGNYRFKVPEQKKIRLIINTDAKNEADDQYAIVHALLTPKFDIKSITGAHFGEDRSETSMQDSYDEIVRILDIMGMNGSVPVLHGAAVSLGPDRKPIGSEGSDNIIAEALKDDPRPLFAAFMGPLTDLAEAVLLCPEICSRMTAVWIGGQSWPDGGCEYNLQNDPLAADVVFRSCMPLWQVPRNVYNLIKVSLAEIQVKVSGCGKIGEYLLQQMIKVNERHADDQEWPPGESWVLGDSAAVGLLMDEHEYDFEIKPAPDIGAEMEYIHSGENRDIRVYSSVDTRFILEDFYSKLKLFCGS